MPPGDYILIVEDDVDLAGVVQLALLAAGYDARTAHDGRAALAVVAQRMPALILLDMLMPVMDGWQFARELRARYQRRAPIVVVTAAEDAAERAGEIDAAGCLGKPYRMTALLALVDRFAGAAHAPS